MQVYVEVRDKDEVGRRRLRQYLGVIVDLLDETSERTERQTDRRTRSSQQSLRVSAERAYYRRVTHLRNGVNDR